MKTNFSRLKTVKYADCFLIHVIQNRENGSVYTCIDKKQKKIAEHNHVQM